MNTTPNQNKKPHTKKIPRTIYLITLGILCILFIYSITSANVAYQTPETQKITTTILRYENFGQFDYTVYLKNNTVYNNKTTLRPGEGVFFKQLIKYVNASFTYTFHINQNATMTGNYSVDAVLQTNLWTKTYPLIPRTSFNETGTTTSYIVNFPINDSYYDHLLSQINEETGVPAQNPLLLIRSSVMIIAKTSNNTITDYFSPDINVSLNQKTLEISKDLTFNQPGSLTKSSTIHQPEIPAQRTMWTILSLAFLIGICLVTFLTARRTKQQSKPNKELKKIKKKYGEWIVETKTNPDITNSQRIEINSLEDLTKVSEEVGKPILMYASPIPLNHRFYVLDEKTMYEYFFKPDEEKTLPVTPKLSISATETISVKEQSKKQKFHRLLFSNRK